MHTSHGDTCALDKSVWRARVCSCVLTHTHTRGQLIKLINYSLGRARARVTQLNVWQSGGGGSRRGQTSALNMRSEKTTFATPLRVRLPGAPAAGNSIISNGVWAMERGWGAVHACAFKRISRLMCTSFNTQVQF